MKHFFALTLFLAGLGSAVPAFSQQQADETSAKKGQDFKKKLPDDLPQSKLLFIKHTLMPLPAERPKDMPRLYYGSRKRHNESAVEANNQLRDAVKDYPYAYRITTQDSVEYYRAQGYKYKLFHTSFNAVLNGTFQGTRGHGMGNNRTYTTTTTWLYVQDLNNHDRYIFDDFSETFIYYYKGQVGMLNKKVSKQFGVKK